ncbi:cellulase family glycosylhydrolase, partial [candidate division KSB1 bacterium]|nr:cellulase family glycosylhydrolase [candidate division KSB1 bacterium]
MHNYLIILCSFFILTQEGFAFLKVSGRDILDNQDQKILLRGMGLGGWLVPEGYQLHIPGYGSPSDIERKIQDLIGPTDTQEFYRLYQQNYVRELDIQKIASWGFNSIRLPFNYRMLSPENQPGVYLEEGFQIIDQTLQWCEKYQLYLILDMHCAPGGQNDGNISDSDGTARLWTDVANQDRTVAIWRKIAERYAKAEWIGGYDLINEPVLPSGYSSTNLRSLYMRITKAIREVDPDHIVFIEGNRYATDFTSLTPPFDTKLVYSFHKYWNETNTPSIQAFMQIRSQFNLPLWMGESGENSNTWFHDCVKLMEDNNIGWCWWTHKKIQTTTSPYSSPISSNYQRILDYWNKTGSKPSQEFARQTLFQMAANLAIEKCDFLPDVPDALFRSDFNSKTLPYKEHHLPGLIQAIDYDLGNVQVAYGDKDYQNAR